MSQDFQTVERRVFMGIGDAVLRLVHVERMYADGVDPSPQLIAERDLIVQALNQQYQLDLGMDCDLDGIPDAIDDDVQVITHAAQTSCCRIRPDQDSSGSRVENLPEASKLTSAPTPVKTETSSGSSRKKPSAAKKPSKASTSRKKAAPKAAKSPAPKRSSRKAAPKTSPKKGSKAPSPKKSSSTKSGGFLSSLFGSDEEK